MNGRIIVDNTLTGVIATGAVLKGRISGAAALVGVIMNNDKKLIGKLTKAKELKGRISAVGGLRGSLYFPVGYEDYEGSYEATPAVEEQIIKTDDKRMTDDFIIKPIPYAAVSNTANGITVTIG